MDGKTELRRMPLTAYGPSAVAYAARLPDSLGLLVFDEIGFAEALDGALERAYNSGPFLTTPIIADRRAEAAFDAARAIVTSHMAFWERRNALDLVSEQRYVLNGKTLLEHTALTKKEKDSLCDVLLAADGIVLRSWTELTRLAQLLGFRPIRSRRLVAPAQFPTPPFRPRRGAKTIVIWAPGLHALRASMFAVAVEELKCPVVIACSAAETAATLNLRATFIEASDTAQLTPYLEEAAAIIDGDPHDPAAAVELAASGLPLAGCFGSGAHEYVDGLYLYDVWDYRSILHAALSALGGEPPQLRPSTPRPQDLIDDPPRLEPQVVEDPPLVSVLIPTLNRPGVLPRVLDSIDRQTYPNVEVILVNDGGESVDSIVQHHPNVTLINNARSHGLIRSFNTALKVARGEYFAFIADDDYFFPTYLTRLVYALERTGESVAAGMCADSYLTPGVDGYYDFIGTSIRPYRSTDPTVLHSIPVSMPAILVRRKAALSVGDFREDARYYHDYDWVLRLANNFDFLWSSSVVHNMDTRLDGSNWSSEGSAKERVSDLSRIWQQHHLAERPDIDAAQAALIRLYISEAPSPLHPMHRGVTRIASPKRSAYRLR